MNVEVRLTKSFKKEAKILLRKYPSFLSDLAILEEKLVIEPTLGESLGNNIYKIRLQIRSKKTGKSGGARVISFVETELLGLVENTEELTVVNLIAIYDKSEQSTIAVAEIKKLIKNIEF